MIDLEGKLLFFTLNKQLMAKLFFYNYNITMSQLNLLFSVVLLIIKINLEIDTPGQNRQKNSNSKNILDGENRHRSV